MQVDWTTAMIKVENKVASASVDTSVDYGFISVSIQQKRSRHGVCFLFLPEKSLVLVFLCGID